MSSLAGTGHQDDAAADAVVELVERARTFAARLHCYEFERRPERLASSERGLRGILTLDEQKISRVLALVLAIHKAQPGLHPAMRARMWKPGQSGNPAGVSKAHAEAVREMSMRARVLSLGAERTRRWRQKRRQGVTVVRLDVAPDITAKLIGLGWLDATKRGDKEAIATALIELAGRATELEVTPASRSM